MAHIDLHNGGTDLTRLRRAMREGAHARRTRRMLAFAGLGAFGMIAVAAALLGIL
ncbi:hypothetical protein [Devosia sp. XK-2]|uniref:hypothetical protein n=1 Tax=Devosia sp. XK-2 TaxID=3126689 RepID=UPI0030D5CE49